MRTSLALEFLSEKAAYEERLCREPTLPTGRRGAPRLRLSIPAKLVTLTDTRRCILVNLSRSGACIGLQEPLHQGAEAILTIAGIDQFGTIVSCEKGGNGGTNGMKFEVPLSDDEVLAMRDFAEGFEADENRSLRAEVRAWVDGAA
ncbi:MAG: PilZ domain-containing protein [Erythrobacter sp.]